MLGRQCGYLLVLYAILCIQSLSSSPTILPTNEITMLSLYGPHDIPTEKLNFVERLSSTNQVNRDKVFRQLLLSLLNDINSQALQAGAIPGIDQDPDAAAEQFAPNNFIRVTRYDVLMSPETRRKDVGDQRNEMINRLISGIKMDSLGMHYGTGNPRQGQYALQKLRKMLLTLSRDNRTKKRNGVGLVFAVTHYCNYYPSTCMK